MYRQISENTQAILLLTSPLLVGKGRSEAHPLSLTEYNKLARNLSDSGREPAGLLRTNPAEMLREWQSGFDINRINRLLERGFLLSQAIDNWQTRAIWVVSRADAEYPQRLKERLGPNSPPVLYGCGDPSLLENGGLAVVGSRNASEELLEYTESIGTLAANAGCAVISGAARGIDQAAMHGALRKFGTAAGVLTGDLERESVNREHREMLLEGHLALVSPYDPKAGFNTGNAMQRNKLIYALADAGLVIDSDYNKGGTWNGAVEQLDKLKLAPVYVRSGGEISAGLQGLRRKGALEWPNPQTPGEFRAVLAGEHTASRAELTQQANFLPGDGVAAEPGQATPVALQPPSAEPDGTPEMSAAEILFTTVEKLIEGIGPSVTESDVAELLQVEKKQAQTWLKRLEQEGKYRRKTKPVHYVRVYEGRFI